jgi:hypothetical protein
MDGNIKYINTTTVTEPDGAWSTWMNTTTDPKMADREDMSLAKTIKRHILIVEHCR